MSKVNRDRWYSLRQPLHFEEVALLIEVLTAQIGRETSHGLDGRKVLSLRGTMCEGLIKALEDAEEA